MTSDQLTTTVRARICTHMNNDHQEALVELAQFYGELSVATSAKMLDLTPEAMKLEVDGNVIDIGFDHKLVDSSDAHRSIVAMLKATHKNS